MLQVDLWIANPGRGRQASEVVRTVRFTVVFTTLALAGSAVQAKPLRPVTLGEVCTTEVARFCPSLAGTTETRNQRICLRPYRTSLSQPCRRALTDAR